MKSDQGKKRQGARAVKTSRTPDRAGKSDSFSGRGGAGKPRRNSAGRPGERDAYPGRTDGPKARRNSDRPEKRDSFSGRTEAGKTRRNPDRQGRSRSYSGGTENDRQRRDSDRAGKSGSFSGRGGAGKPRRTSSARETERGTYSNRAGAEKTYKRSPQKQEAKRPQKQRGIEAPLHEEPVRLNRYIALCGETSRRKADELIADGAVSVNGKIVTELGIKIDPEKDEIAISGKPVRQTKHKLYILLHKPKDVLTTSSDERNRRTVLDLVNVGERIYPIGRLDRDTTGVLVLTNDGELAHRLMHPSYGVKKEYVATLDQKCTKEGVQKLKTGFRLKDTGEKVSPCDAKILDDGHTVWLSIHEGKNHQVHRMFWTLGYNVKKLARTTYGGIGLGTLKRGEWRALTPKEVDRLYKMVSLDTQKLNSQKNQPKHKESV